MNPYLSMLKSRKRLPGELPKLSKAPREGMEPPFDGFGGSLGRHFPESTPGLSTGSAYFKATYLRLVDDLDQAWPILPQERKDRVYSLVDDLDATWLGEDRAGFDQIIEAIRQTATPSGERTQQQLFEVPAELSDPA